MESVNKEIKKLDTLVTMFEAVKIELAELSDEEFERVVKYLKDRYAFWGSSGGIFEREKAK